MNALGKAALLLADPGPQLKTLPGGVVLSGPSAQTENKAETHNKNGVGTTAGGREVSKGEGWLD